MVVIASTKTKLTALVGGSITVVLLLIIFEGGDSTRGKRGNGEKGFLGPLSPLLSHVGNGWTRITRSFHKSHYKPRRAEDALTPMPKDLDRHLQFLERAKQGDIDVLFVGDSITNLFQSIGEQSWRKLGRFKPGNFGIDGDCTEHVLWRLEHGELDGISPKLVVLLIGTNNVFYFPDETPRSTAGAVEKIVKLIQERLPTSKVLLFGIFPRNDKGSRTRRTVAAVNRELRHLDDGGQVRFIDIGDQFFDPDGNIPFDIMPDQVHLSAKGYEIWYRSLEPILSEILK